MEKVFFDARAQRRRGEKNLCVSASKKLQPDENQKSQKKRCGIPSEWLQFEQRINRCSDE
jgi:hypothetical protein